MNLIAELTARVEEYRAENKNPCKNYATEAAAVANGDTYAIHHMGETTWMSGSTAVARWLCDNYGLKLDRMPQLVEQIEAHRKLSNEDLGLRIVNMSKPLHELRTMLVHCEGKLEPRSFTVNTTHQPGRMEPELMEGEGCWYSVDGSAHVVKGVW